MTARRVWTTTAAIAVGLIAMAGCPSDGGGEPTGDPTDAETTAQEQPSEDATTAQEPTSEVSDPAYNADAVAALLPTLSPGGLASGEWPEMPEGLEDFRPRVTACYEVLADEDDGELINAFYGDWETGSLWITVVATPDNATGTEIATTAIELNAACEGSTPEDELVPQESVDSGTATVAGAPAGFNINALDDVVGGEVTFDARIVLGLDNLVIEIVTGRPDPDAAKTAGLEVATELIEAIQPLAG